MTDSNTYSASASPAGRARPLRAVSVLRTFLRSGAAGGIFLMLAAAAALVIANSALADTYFAVLHFHVGPLSVLHWVDDALMALFFLLVGLEIKRELVDGHLSSWADRTLPGIAAAVGMIVPALIYLAVASGTPGLSRGWAIPTATDIAFAIGVMALLGSRVPASLKLLLTTVAIVDDMGAVAVIALAYTHDISGLALLGAAAVMGVMFILNRAGVARLWPFMVLTAMLWVAIWASGIHATIAGVLAASLIPLRRSPGCPDDAGSPLHRLEHGLQPWVAFVVVPIFGFANAGVSLTGITLATLLLPVPLGVALGLFLGKQIGVFGGLWTAVRLGWAGRPGGTTWLQVYGMALLCGIGFTMSLFIGGLAFADAALADQVKVGVLLGSVLSAVAGFAVLGLAPRPTGRRSPKIEHNEPKPIS